MVGSVLLSPSLQSITLAAAHAPSPIRLIANIAHAMRMDETSILIRDVFEASGERLRTLIQRGETWTPTNTSASNQLTDPEF